MHKSIKSWSLSAPKKNAETMRQHLLKNKLLRTDLKIKKGKKYVHFPIKKQASPEIKKMEFETHKKTISFKEYATSLIKKTYGKIIHIPSSFDVIGDIALIRLPDEVMTYKKEIGESLLAVYKHLHVACIDKGVKGEKRIRDIEIIAGEKRTETMHREHGIAITLDLKKVYFSPRLATERKRIAEMIQHGDNVIDMFAGAAPFSLVIAALSTPQRVYAIDKNPDAIYYARKNVWYNKLASKIKILQGDAATTVRSLPQADHIIMNLPHSSFEFFPLALSKGKMIHYYEIMEKEKIQDTLTLLEKAAMKHGKRIQVTAVRRVGTYSSNMVKIGVDILIRENTSQRPQGILP
jgi:tRNA (guanine37-N1)-methyltransferase